MFHRKNKRTLSEDYERAHTVVQADKSVMSDACKALVLQDFTEKFFEYFEVDGLPKMEISVEDGMYLVNIKFAACRIKKFNVLK